MSKAFDIEQFIAGRAEAANLTNKSYIVTVFGDVVSQHKGWIWLGSLIESLKPLGFSERLIRTSVFRLVKDDWLQVSKAGRRSYYAFTESANKHYTKAARRIYAGTSPHSDGDWLIVIPCFVTEDKIVQLKRQLSWLGFSQLSSGAFAHPSIAQSSLEETINELKLNGSVIMFNCRTLDKGSNLALKKLVREKWDIEQLQNDYLALMDCYLPVLNKVKNGMVISSHQSFILRTLIIHEYRRILLKDHELPEELLPDNWSGFGASQVVKSLYAHLAESSCEYITTQLYNANGFLPVAEKDFNFRFRE